MQIYSKMIPKCLKCSQRRAKSGFEEYLNRAEFASLEELAAEVGVSVSTVRRDLDALEETGSLRRTHGGAQAGQPAFG